MHEVNVWTNVFLALTDENDDILTYENSLMHFKVKEITLKIGCLAVTFRDGSMMT